MVVLYHLHDNILPAVQSWFPRTLSLFVSHLNLGVDIFFVLSGFIIAYSVRSGRHTLGYLGRFGLRRSIRLDPPLWLTIVLELLLIRVTLMLFPLTGAELPSWGAVLANMTYSQRFLGLPDVSPVFWSLTYEVQFYIVLVGALVLLRGRSSKGAGEVSGSNFSKVSFLLLFFYSLFIWIGIAPLPLRGLFIDRWFQFALGIAACSVLLGGVRFHLFVLLCALTLLLTVGASPGSYRSLTVITALSTALALAHVGRTKRMDRVLSGRTIQFLGRISYSLYLIHLTIGWRFVSLAKELLGPQLGIVTGTATFFGGVLISVLAAWTMYRVLEAPSIGLARRVQLPTAPSEGLQLGIVAAAASSGGRSVA